VISDALQKLEDELLQITTILEWTISLYGLDYRDVPSPSTFGYRRVHKMDRYAVRAIKRSREAFIPLMAWISYLIASKNDCMARLDDTDYRQWEHILGQHGITQDIIQDLKQSEIVDFTILRAGVFIDYK
jgi:hypothetical protein